MNPYKIRYYSALLISPLLSCFLFALLLYFYNIWFAVGGMLIGAVLGLIIGMALLSHPMIDALLGKGLLVLTIDSTGLIEGFLMNVINPFIRGKYRKEDVSGVFDRNSVFNFSPITKLKTPASKTEEGGLNINLTKEDYNRGRFNFFHLPCLIYNKNLGTIITKDVLSETEKTMFAEYTVLFLNRLMEQLTGYTRDFGRYIVELTRPKENLFANKWFIWILVIGMIILGIIFLPKVIEIVSGSGIGNTIQQATGTITQAGG